MWAARLFASVVGAGLLWLASAAPLAAADPPSVRVTHSTGEVTQGASGGTTLYLSFDTERWDSDGFHVAAPSGRLTVPTGLDGLYEVGALIYFQPGASQTGYRDFWVRLNGTTVVAYSRTDVNAAGPAGGSIATAVMPVQLVAGDYLEVGVLQNSGNTITVSASPYREFWLVKLEAGGGGGGAVEITDFTGAAGTLVTLWTDLLKLAIFALVVVGGFLVFMLAWIAVQGLRR